MVTLGRNLSQTRSPSGRNNETATQKGTWANPLDGTCGKMCHGFRGPLKHIRYEKAIRIVTELTEGRRRGKQLREGTKKKTDLTYWEHTKQLGFPGNWQANGQGRRPYYMMGNSGSNGSYQCKNVIETLRELKKTSLKK